MYVFAGGGTGGHLAPGIAVAEQLRKNRPDCRIRFAGAGRPVEWQMLEPTGFEYSVCDTQPLRGALRRPYQFSISHLRAYREASRSVARDRPAAIIGLGGFASIPFTLVAKRQSVPCVLLEQNTIPGKANRWLARWHPICLTFDESLQHLPRNAVTHLTGNPLRQEIYQLATTVCSRSGDQPKILVLGGSLGSEQVNVSMMNAVEHLAQDLAGWRIVHQTGPQGVDDVRAAYARSGIPHDVAPFFSDVSRHLSDATLVVARAGATTLTELAAVGIPAVLIPYPEAADDHQTRNAEYFRHAGAAEIAGATDQQFAPVNLTSILKTLINDQERLARMSQAMRTLARPDATVEVVAILDSLTG